MATYKVLYWYDIPTQVRAEDKDGKVNLQLPQRFQLAIDEVAMAAKLISDDDYTNGYKWCPAQEMPGSAKEVAEAVVSKLDAKFPEIKISPLVEKIRKKKS
jgi:hypothetical protein